MNRQAQSPTVSVMIPYYNCKEYIVETIQSVLSQSHQNFEIIIVDDGSDPEHADYLKGFLADKPAIRYAVQNNQGVAAARNHAARLAGGKYFLFLDSDDLILPDYIEKCVTVLENNPDCKLVYPLAEYFDAQEGLWNLPDYDGLESLLKGNRIPIISMHRAEDFVSLGGFDENLTTHEDWDLWIRLLSNGGTVIRIPEVLFRYRKRRDGSSLINRLEQNPDLNREDWQKVYEKNRVLFMQYHLGYSDCIQKISLLEQQIQSLSELNLQLREDNTNMQNQNQELQHVMAKLLQQTELSVEQTEFLQQQIEMLLRNSTVEEQLEEQEKQIKLLKKQIDTLQQEKQSLEQSIHKENRRLAKYKGLWTVKVFKPFVKTEQAISSANRYRKGFRFLVREKGSIGKAYQFLRRHYKQTHSIKSVKQILKAVSSASAFEHSIQADSIPQTFIHRLTKHAADTLAPKVAIIAELSIPQCKKYRVIQKQEMLEELGIPCSVTSWTDSNEAKKQISLASLVIFYRVPGFDSVMDLIAECRRLNIKTLWDVDDLIFDEDVLKTSSTINSLEPAEKEGVINGAKLYRQAMLACNEGIASTSGLAKAISPQAIGSTQLASAVRFESAAKGKTKVLSFNVYYHPQSFGGATIVAEQLNKLLADEEAYEIYAVTTLPMKSWLPPYSVIRYEYGKVTVFGVAVPSEDAAAHENPRFDAAVKDIIELVQPDIAHIHCIQSMGVGMVDICREAGVKTLVTLHDAWWICPNQFMLDENEVFREQWNTEDERSKTIARALSKIDILLAPSKYFAELHERTLGRNVLVNKNGVTRPLGQISKRKKDVIRFGYVGGKTKIKGVHLILEAFRKHRFPNTELVVVDNLLNLGARSFFDSDFDGVERFRIEPAYSQDTIDHFFSEIDVLLFPTQWKESFGLTVREAVLRDVWVIATDAGGVSEDIIDGENGTVIPFDSGVEELSRAIAEVCERYQAMDDGAVIELPKSHIRTFAEQKDELAGLYQEILSNQAD